uniref:Uncharacterized protein n=1 Tax=Schistosoma japonicum TaxID=6182 RepID=C7TXT9_SCHJA|nr:hypothetical protein [Schistosoma japonicum]
MALSSSLLYISVLLLLFIHSSIQIDDLFKNLTQRINSSKEAVDVFERILGTTDNNIQQLISKLTEANPNQNETVNNYVSCQSQVISEEYHNESIEYIEDLEKEVERDYPNNSRSAIEMLRNEKSKLQLTFNMNMLRRGETSYFSCDFAIFYLIVK